MIADAGDEAGEIGLGVHAIEFATLDQGEEDRGALAAAVGSEEGPVAASERQRANRALGRLLLISRRPSSVKRQSVFETYDDIIDAACEAWRNLMAIPDTITSIGLRDWAHIGQES